MEIKENITENNPHKNKVHRVLIHSYLSYFFIFLVGFSIDLVFKLEAFANAFWVPVGVGVLTLATILILWAQTTNHKLPKGLESKEMFCRGPYCYTKYPTHWGLLLLMIGFGITADAPFLILSAFVYFYLAKSVFLKKEDKILSDKYGAPYKEYKETVKF